MFERSNRVEQIYNTQFRTHLQTDQIQIKTGLFLLFICLNWNKFIAIWIFVGDFCMPKLRQSY